ncbi:MAG: ATP-binding protein [Proteobacteria bacterium]|nr:ATP-binding protein [Pseudomonadota bacterium]
MFQRFSATPCLFVKAFCALLLAVMLSMLCTSHVIKPEMQEPGNAIHISPLLLQDLLSASVGDKPLPEIAKYLEQRNEPFLNQAQVETISDLMASDAPQKYGFWLKKYERMQLLNKRPVSIGKFKTGSHHNSMQPFQAFSPAQDPASHASHKQHAKADKPDDPGHKPPPAHLITIQMLLSSAQHITAPDPELMPKWHRSGAPRPAHLFIPIKNTPYVIMIARPPQLPPVITLPSILLGTGLILLIILCTVSILILPIALRVYKIAATCQKVYEGDYSARCGIKGKDFIGRLATNVDDMTTSIETHLNQQKSLLQAIAHELMTPLSRIRFTLEMLDLPEDDENAQARLASIDEDLTEIDNLTKELSYFNYVDAGNGRRNFELSAVKDLIELTLRQRSLALEPFKVEVSGLDDALMIEADPNAFKRVIGNLLSNAARYAKEQIRISVRHDDAENMIEISIDDDGQGIPEDKRTAIFDPFVCLEKSRSKAAGGFGLGLAIAHRIMKIHSGTISAHASELGGAKFITRWPITQPDP